MKGEPLQPDLFRVQKNPRFLKPKPLGFFSGFY